MEIKTDTCVGEIVRVNFKTAKLFEENRIDFCCNGGISLSEACKKSNVDINKLLLEIETLIQTNDPDSKYIEEMELDALCDYIVKRHHSYVSENIVFIKQKITKLCDVHGQNHKELFKIAGLFEITAGNLTAHMQNEELILFPYIKKMVMAKKDNQAHIFELGKVIELINQMEIEHQSEGQRFEEIAKLSQNYSVPPDGCNTFEVTYRTLHEFEQDLHRHIHIENNILFKKAIILEEELASNTNI